MAQLGKWWKVIAAMLGVGATLVGALAVWWYPQQAQVPFHWFDDSAEWLAIDKLGHFSSTFQLSWMGLRMLHWVGMPTQRAATLSALLNWLLVSSIELMDGFAAGYGASVYDLLANAAGAFSFWIMQYKMKRVSFFPKISYWPSGLAPLRPEILGSNYVENFIKDYSGHTIWLLWDVNTMLGKRVLPPWLVLCVGYKATGMLGGHDNVWQDSTGHTQDYSHIARAQRWYLSIDLHPTVLRTGRYKWLDALSYPLRWWIKLPAPTLELGERGLVWHWLHL